MSFRPPCIIIIIVLIILYCRVEGHGRDHRAERRAAVHDGNEGDGQGQVQGVRRVHAAAARRPDYHGAADFDLDRREEQNSVPGVVRLVQRGVLEPAVGMIGARAGRAR